MRGPDWRFIGRLVGKFLATHRGAFGVLAYVTVPFSLVLMGLSILGGRSPGDPDPGGAPYVFELALSAGVRLDVVSRQLGHASIATTGNHYSHDTDAAGAEAAGRVGHLLGGGP